MTTFAIVNALHAQVAKKSIGMMQIKQKEIIEPQIINKRRK